MKNPHRFSEPYPKNPRIPRVKTNGHTKIKLNLEDAHKLADIIHGGASKALIYSPKELQLINLLIKKLRNAEPEIQF